MKEKTNEELLYDSMKQAYQFFMENDDDSMDLVIKGISDDCGRVYSIPFRFRSRKSKA